jgi:Ca-activated chloride channel family protein
MIFADPKFFILLLLLPILAAVQYSWRRRSAVEFPDLSLFSQSPTTWRQRLLFLPPLLECLALAALVCALARPKVEIESERQEREGIAIELVIDVSSSMDININYKNEQSTRMEVAKKVVEEFISGNGKDLQGRPDDLIGIITFARYADTISPMTLSHEALVHMVGDIEVNDRPNEDGTAYGDAVALACAKLATMSERGKRGDIRSKVVVLLTDGENNCGKHLPLQAAALAKKWKIKTYTISIQEREPPTVVETGSGEFLEPKPPTESDRILKKMAETTGGIFRKAYDFDSLKAVYHEIDSLEKSRMKAVSYKDYGEAFASFALAALALLLLGHLLRTTWLRVAP